MTTLNTPLPIDPSITKSFGGIDPIVVVVFIVFTPTYLVIGGKVMIKNEYDGLQLIGELLCVLGIGEINGTVLNRMAMSVELKGVKKLILDFFQSEPTFSSLHKCRWSQLNLFSNLTLERFLENLHPNVDNESMQMYLLDAIN